MFYVRLFFPTHMTSGYTRGKKRVCSWWTAHDMARGVCLGRKEDGFHVDFISDRRWGSKRESWSSLFLAMERQMNRCMLFWTNGGEVCPLSAWSPSSGRLRFETVSSQCNHMLKELETDPIWACASWPIAWNHFSGGVIIKAFSNQHTANCQVYEWVFDSELQKYCVLMAEFIFWCSC